MCVLKTADEMESVVWKFIWTAVNVAALAVYSGRGNICFLEHSLTLSQIVLLFDLVESISSATFDCLMYRISDESWIHIEKCYPLVLSTNTKFK